VLETLPKEGVCPKAAILELLALIVTDLLYEDANLRFHGLRCGKFSISGWLSAPGTGLELTRFLDRCTANRARLGELLFQREFLSFHQRTIQPFPFGKCSILPIFNMLHKVAGFSGSASSFCRLRKSEHLLKSPF
jgi:hypothetical protein